MDKATVYFTSKITPESLKVIYNKLDVKLTGKIGVKILAKVAIFFRTQRSLVAAHVNTN